MSLRWVVVFLSLLLSGCTDLIDAFEPDEPWTDSDAHIVIEDGAETGSRSFYVLEAGPHELFGVFNFTWRLDAFSTMGIVFRSDNGTIEPLIVGYEYDDQHMGGGQDVVHIGTPAGSVGTPEVLSSPPISIEAPFQRTFGDGPGHLIVYWANSPTGFRLDVWLDDALVIPGPTPSVDVFTHRDGEQGVHVSSPAAYVTRAEGLAIGEGAGVLLVGRAEVSDVGTGELVVVGPSLEERLSLDGTPGQGCIACYSSHRLLAYDEGWLGLQLEYTGNNRQTRLMGVGLSFDEPLGGVPFVAISEIPDA